MPEETLDPKDFQDLIDKAAQGTKDAIETLRRVGGGRFEGKPWEDIPPMFRSAYPDPLKSDVDFDELRAAREYDVRVVDDIVNRVCDPNWLPPGAAMMLFVYMCTGIAATMSMYGGQLRAKLMQVYKAWDESHPWVKANILYKMRDRFHEEHHLTFCRAFAAKARQYDKIVEKERSAEQEEVTDGETNEQGGLREDPA